jgi:hypothetical protein
MITVTKDLQLTATPEDVVGFLLDLSRWEDWFVLHRTWLSPLPTEVKVGTRLKQRIRIIGVPGDISWTVTMLEAPDRIRLAGRGSARTSIDLDFHLMPTYPGTRISFTARLGGLALAPLKARLAPEVAVKAERSLMLLAELVDGT